MKCPNPHCTNQGVQQGDKFCGACGQPIQPTVKPPPQNTPPPPPPKTHQPISVVEVDFKTALKGGVVEARVEIRDADGKLQERPASVQIPPCTPEGTLLGLKSRTDGSITPVSVLLKKHPLWQHNKAGSPKCDLFMVMPASQEQARHGAVLEVPVIEGAARVKLPPGSSTGMCLRVAGMGLPKVQGTSERGDLLVNLIVSDAAAQHHTRWGAPALELLAAYGVSAAEQCMKEGWSPDEWRRRFSRNVDRLFDDMFQGNPLDAMFGGKKQ